MNKGDYVFATKYTDGDPGDAFCLGFYDGELPGKGARRHLVLNDAGQQFRPNGFRRCEPITHDEGLYIIQLIADGIEQSPGASLWKILGLYRRLRDAK